MKKLNLILLSVFLTTAQLFAQSGTFGDGDALTWEYNNTTKTLTIGGSGIIPRYKYSSIDGNEPWMAYKSSIEQIVIGDGITEIGRSAFDNLAKLSHVTIGGSVEVIGDEAFSGCTKLGNIAFPNSLKSIGKDAFALCSSMNVINLPKSLTNIGEAAFINCGTITIYANSSIPPTATDAFEESVVTMVYLTKCEDVSAYSADDYWQEFNMQGPDKYSLSVVSADLEHGTVDGSGDYYCGNFKTITATATDPGYDFDRWSDDNTDNPRVVRISEDVTYTAYFKIKSFKVSFYDATNTDLIHEVEVNYTNDVEDSDIETAKGNLRTYLDDHGLLCSELKDWTGGTLTNITADQTLIATYKNIPYTVTATVNDASFGKVLDETNNPVEEPFPQYDCGTKHSFKAEAEPCYKFVKWIINGTTEETANPLEIKIESDINIEAQFEATKVTVTFKAGEGGTEVLGTPFDIDCGSDIPAEYVTMAEAAAADIAPKCKEFDKWDKETTAITANTIITAQYKPLQYEVVVTSDENGTVKILDELNHVITGPFDCDATLKLVAEPKECYKFKQWDDGNTDNPRIIENLDENKSFAAQFEKTTFTVTFKHGDDIIYEVNDIECGGFVAQSAIDAAQVLAEGEAGNCFIFKEWTPEITATTVINEDKTIIAVYDKEKFDITVLSEDESKGTVTGSGNYDCQSEATLGATPKEGYDFDYWEDDNSTENPHKVTVTEDKTYTAHFKIKTFTVVFKYDDLVFYKMEDVPYGYMLTVENAAEALAAFESYMPDCETFDHWAGIPTEVKEDKVIVLHTKKAKYNLTGKSENTDYGTVTGSGEYDCGKEVDRI